MLTVLAARQAIAGHVAEIPAVAATCSRCITWIVISAVDVDDRVFHAPLRTDGGQKRRWRIVIVD